MKVLSFDVGIKNMAYCCLLIDASNIQITDWGILDLLNTNTINYSCNACVKTKNKVEKLCNKKAKYKKDNHFFVKNMQKPVNIYYPTKIQNFLF